MLTQFSPGNKKPAGAGLIEAYRLSVKGLNTYI